MRGVKSLHKFFIPLKFILFFAVLTHETPRSSGTFCSNKISFLLGIIFVCEGRMGIGLFLFDRHRDVNEEKGNFQLKNLKK